MKKITNIEDTKYYQDLKERVNDHDILIYTKKILEPLFNTSKSMFKRRYETIVDIISSHGEFNLSSLYEEYYITNDKRRKLFIRYGKEKVNDYDKKLKARKKASPNSHFSRSYWLKKGYSENDAIEIISDIQRKNALKRKKESYRGSACKMKHSLDYWLARGYDREQSIILREPYLKPMIHDITSFIERYGNIEGKRRYREKNKKWRDSYEKNRSTHKSAGYVSRESLKFFIPIYKNCRKIGIPRNKIYFGINGSREFFIRHSEKKNRGRFFDFAIPSIGVIIEYNGSFWHPRERVDWKNPWVSYDDAILVEEEKQRLCNNRGFLLLTVWDTDDKIIASKNIMSIIQNKYEKELHVK